METKEVARFIDNEIEEQYNTFINFCNKNSIGYMKFVNKISAIKRGKDFRFRAINDALNLLGYEFQIVKKSEDKKTL